MQGSDVTGLLVAWSNGEEGAGTPLMDAVYDELRRLARAYLVRERRDHSLPATALVHEAYLKLVDQRRVRWQNRAHFFAVAAQVMRRLLVDHARARGASKRGPGLTRAARRPRRAGGCRGPRSARPRCGARQAAAIDARQARLVELRFFGGLDRRRGRRRSSDIAPITVKRDWALARTWLFRELRGSP